jgi:hypothetical protein
MTKNGHRVLRSLLRDTAVKDFPVFSSAYVDPDFDHLCDHLPLTAENYDPDPELHVWEDHIFDDRRNTNAY